MTSCYRTSCLRMSRPSISRHSSDDRYPLLRHGLIVLESRCDGWGPSPLTLPESEGEGEMTRGLADCNLFVPPSRLGKGKERAADCHKRCAYTNTYRRQSEPLFSGSPPTRAPDRFGYFPPKENR